MEGPFMIIYEDDFGFEHKVHITAQTSEQAIERFERHMDEGSYFYTIKEVYLDWDAILNLTSVSRRF